MTKNVLVLGSGVSGMTVALKLARAGARVTVWSREAAGQFAASSYNAYAMWWPVADAAQPRLEQWANDTRDELTALATDASTGVVLRKVMSLKTSHQTPWFAKLAGFRHAAVGEVSSQYADAHVVEGCPIVDPVVYLPWLHNQALVAGVQFEQRVVTSFGDCPAVFDAVVNCTSLGARQLTGDKDLYPSRFQVVKIKHNGFDSVVFDDEGPNKRACIVPHRDYIKLGAVVDEHIETTEIDDAATLDILQRCSKMVSGFKADLEDVLSVARAFRPERRFVRVEREDVNGRVIVHHYGHDGMGYIIAAGTASEVVKLVQ